MKLFRWLLLAAVPIAAQAQYATLTGQIQATNGLPASNYTLSFTPSQLGFISGTGVAVNTTTFCATSVDGSVVGLPNPLTPSVVTPSFTGTLPAGNYYVEYSFYTSTTETLAGPETVAQLTSTGTLTVAAPISGIPAGSIGMRVYVGQSSGTETLQGSTTGTAAFLQSIPLVAGSALPATNTTACKQLANDVIWPIGTGYTVSLSDPSGNTLPGYPMMWQLLGAGTTINLSSGLPYYNGVVLFPTPILASPLNHATQSISGSLSLTNYNLINVGRVGVGTGLPAYPVDVRNGAVNASGGFLANGNGGTSGQGLCSDGTAADTFCNFITSVQQFYQTVASNGTAQTQRPTLNFSPRFTAADSASPAQTTIDLASTTTAATCNNPSSVTYDTYGRITSCTPSSPSSILAYNTGTSCTLATDSLSQPSCSTTFSWAASLGTTSYWPVCTLDYPTAGGAYPGGTFGPSAASPTGFNTLAVTATNFTYVLASHQSGANGASFLMHCFAISHP